MEESQIIMTILGPAICLNQTFHLSKFERLLAGWVFFIAGLVCRFVVKIYLCKKRHRNTADFVQWVFLTWTCKIFSVFLPQFFSFPHFLAFRTVFDCCGWDKNSPWISCWVPHYGPLLMGTFVRCQRWFG